MGRLLAPQDSAWVGTLTGEYPTRLRDRDVLPDGLRRGNRGDVIDERSCITPAGDTRVGNVMDCRPAASDAINDRSVIAPPGNTCAGKAIAGWNAAGYEECDADWGAPRGRELDSRMHCDCSDCEQEGCAHRGEAQPGHYVQCTSTASDPVPPYRPAPGPVLSCSPTPGLAPPCSPAQGLAPPCRPARSLAPPWSPAPGLALLCRPASGLALLCRPAQGLVPLCRPAQGLAPLCRPAPGLAPPCSSTPLAPAGMSALNLTMCSLLPVCPLMSHRATSEASRMEWTNAAPRVQEIRALAEARTSGGDQARDLCATKISDPSDG